MTNVTCHLKQEGEYFSVIFTNYFKQTNKNNKKPYSKKFRI